MRLPFPLCSAVGAGLLAMAAFPWIVPRTDRHHAGLYAVVLMLGIIVLARRMYMVSRARSIAMTPLQSAIRADAIAGAGAALVAVAALSASLLAPETRIIAAGPLAQVDLPYHPGCRVQFPALDTPAAAAPYVVTCTKDPIAVLPGGRSIIGSSLLTPVLRDAFSVQVTDAGGARQTITRPQGGGFLAPVFIFAQSTEIAGMVLPSDAIAVPAKSLRILGFSIDADTARAAKFSRLTGGRVGILLTVQHADGSSIPDGIAFLADGGSVAVAGLQITGRARVFPAVQLTSVGAPFPTIVGFGGFLGGVVSVFLHRRRYVTSLAQTQSSAPVSNA